MVKLRYFILLLVFFGCSLNAQAKEELTIAVASSLYSEMQQLAVVFEKKHHVHVRLVSGSTGRLYNQILQGAPFDVFIAADEIRPDLLLKHGKALSKYTAGQGYLGLMLGDTLVTNLEQLTKPGIQHIGIANPGVAPFGLATKAVLQEQGIWQTLKPKFIYAQNALQASMLVQKGLVDAGFIPVTSTQPSIAKISYFGVLLEDKDLARFWLESITVNQGTQLALQAELQMELLRP